MPASHTTGLFGKLAPWAERAFTLDTRSLALYRIGLGGLLIADCLLRSRDFALMVSPDGIFPPATVRTYLGGPTHWSLSLLHDSAWWNGCVLALEGVAGAMLAVGLQTRLATILGWVAVVSVIRRTVLANNAGDIWLACQLFWAMFLPLGSRWSLDGWRQTQRGSRPTAIFSIASAALVLQLAAVYLGAGIAKCNSTWLTGEPLVHAVSVHDHGTPFGMVIIRLPGLAAPLQRAILCSEIALPIVLVVLPAARIRTVLILLAVLFHSGIWFMMSLGLFAAIGIVAWLPLLPSIPWPPATAHEPRRVIGLSHGATWGCGLAGCLAGVTFILQSVAGPVGPLPQPLAAAVNLGFLSQEWRMFGSVRGQEQWVSCRATLADGRLIDPLRGGRPAEPGLPSGGFTSLPNHRWHRFLWRLPAQDSRDFAAPAAAALARHWNAHHDPLSRIVNLEIRCGTAEASGGDGTVRDRLLAAWPPRSASGAGSLDRFLEAHEAEAPASP